MKRLVLLAWMLIGIIGSASAQRDDLYFVPKKKVKAEAQDPALQESPLEKDVNHVGRTEMYVFHINLFLTFRFCM